MIIKCVDCKNDCKIDYSQKITLKGENYYLAICKACGKRHFIKEDSIDSITVNIKVDLHHDLQYNYHVNKKEKE